MAIWYVVGRAVPYMVERCILTGVMYTRWIGSAHTQLEGLEQQGSTDPTAQRPKELQEPNTKGSKGPKGRFKGSKEPKKGQKGPKRARKRTKKGPKRPKKSPKGLKKGLKGPKTSP